MGTVGGEERPAEILTQGEWMENGAAQCPDGFSPDPGERGARLCAGRAPEERLGLEWSLLPCLPPDSGEIAGRGLGSAVSGGRSG